MANEQPIDVCIVGSGAGGATVAYALGMAGFSVVVLEAGPRYDPSQYPLNTQEWEQHSSAFRVAPEDQGKHAYTSTTTEELDPNYAHLRSWSEARGQFNTSSRRGAPQVHRVKGVGGTTLHYQGEAHRFSPHGFRSKSLYGYGDDWPLRYEDLAPYYERIENLLGFPVIIAIPLKLHVTHSHIRHIYSAVPVNVSKWDLIDLDYIYSPIH